MHAQYQKRIPPTIPKNPIDDHKIYTVIGKNTTIKQSTFIPFFAYYHCKETLT